MGLQSAQGGYTTYLTMREGYLVQKDDPTIEGERVEFENPGGAKKTYVVHRSLIGKIDDITIQESEYNGRKIKRLMIWISDGPEKYCLQSRYDRGIAKDFYRVMENIDYSEECKLMHIPSGDFFNLLVQQRLKEPVKTDYKEYKRGDWKGVSWSMPYEEIPKPKETMVNNEPVKDYTDQLNYFAKKLVGVQERLKTLQTVDAVVVDENDDLPF